MTDNPPSPAGPLPSERRNANQAVPEARRLALISAQSMGLTDSRVLLKEAEAIEQWLIRDVERSDGAASRSATEGAAPASAAPEGRHPSIRERAFDAAQRLVLSQPHMAIGQLEQYRMADYILELAAGFNAWMLINPEVTVEPVWSGWDYSK